MVKASSILRTKREIDEYLFIPARWVRHSPFLNNLIKTWCDSGLKCEMDGRWHEAISYFKLCYDIIPCSDIAFYRLRSALNGGLRIEAMKALKILKSIDPLRASSPFILEHPTFSDQGSLIGKHATSIWGENENKNTVPPQDENQCKAPHQM